MKASWRPRVGIERAILQGTVVCLGLSLGACPPSRQLSKDRAARSEAAITIPPGPRELSILRRGQERRDCAGRREAARLLFDLHDVWRSLRGEHDELSREQRRVGKAVDALLRAELGVEALAPDAELVRRLRQRVGALPQSCPKRATKSWAAAALRLMALEQPEAAEGITAFRWATDLRRRVIAGGPLADNARLRLLRACARTFRHALREPPQRQRRVLSRCLYALYEADPAPYFAADPALRAPLPPWSLLRDKARSQWKALESSRLAALAKLQRRADQAFFKRGGALLPAAVDLARLKLPISARGRPHDGSPVVTALAEIFLVDGLLVERGDAQGLRRAIRKRLRGDQRGALTVVMPAGSPAGAIYELGRAAQREKVHTLLLGVRRLVATKTVPGDVQATMAGKGPVYRLEGIPVSVRLLALRPGDTDRDRPRALLYDPLAAQARLALVCTAKSWRLESRYGAMQALRAGDIQGLRRQLLRLQRVFPDEGGLILAAAHGLSFAQLVEVVEHVRYRGRQPLFPAVALGQRYGLGSGSGALEQLLGALEGARVQSATPLETGRRAALSACCRRAIARGFEADEPLAPLVITRARSGRKASVGATAWRACLSAQERPAKKAPRCLPGAPPAGVLDAKSKP